MLLKSASSVDAENHADQNDGSSPVHCEKFPSSLGEYRSTFDCYIYLSKDFTLKCMVPIEVLSKRKFSFSYGRSTL